MLLKGVPLPASMHHWSWSCHVKGCILIDHIVPLAKRKKNDDSGNCHKLAGGPSGSTKLLFLFCPSLANTCHWKTSRFLTTPGITHLGSCCSVRKKFPSLVVLMKAVCGERQKTVFEDSKEEEYNGFVNEQLLSTVQEYGSTSLAGVY